MNNELHLFKLNESFMRIDTELSIQRELQDEFSYDIPNVDFVRRAKDIPSHKWNGRKKLYKLRERKLPLGLLPRVLKFSEQRGYKVIKHFADNEPLPFKDVAIPRLVLKHEPYDFQLASVAYCLNAQRGIVLSPTGSGKSLIIYLLANAIHTLTNGGKILIIDPTVGLINQMRSDFLEYNLPVDKVQIIKEGETKEITKPITISTWQSLQNDTEEFFNQFTCVIADEVHLFKANQLSGIIERCTKLKYKFGFTATLEDSLMSELVLTGLFGETYVAATIHELIKRGILCDLEVKSVILNHTDFNRKLCSRMNYSEEMEYICMNEERNKLILDLADSLSDNTLILFQYIEKHGEVLHDMLKNLKRNKPFYYISGKVKEKVREQYRKELIASNGNDILASYQTFSFGINVPNITNILLASPFKSRIRLLQGIGRGVRKHSDKTLATVYDFGDNMRWRNINNITMNHFISRVETINKEGFKYTIRTFNLKKDQTWNLSD